MPCWGVVTRCRRLAVDLLRVAAGFPPVVMPRRRLATAILHLPGGFPILATLAAGRAVRSLALAAEWLELVTGCLALAMGSWGCAGAQHYWQRAGGQWQEGL